MVEIANKRLSIGVMLDDFEEDCQSLIFSGISEYAKKFNINLTVFIGTLQTDLNEIDYHYNAIIDFINKNNIDGFVIVGGPSHNFYCPKKNKIVEEQLKTWPIVSVAFNNNEIDSVLVKNRIGMEETVTHLIKEHKRHHIAFIKGPEELLEAKDRFLAFSNALKNNNIQLDPRLIVPGSFSQSSGRNGVITLLDKRKVSFDAIVASDDSTAIRELKELRERGVRVRMAANRVPRVDNVDISDRFWSARKHTRPA